MWEQVRVEEGAGLDIVDYGHDVVVSRHAASAASALVGAEGNEVV